MTKLAIVAALTLLACKDQAEPPAPPAKAGSARTTIEPPPTAPADVGIAEVDAGDACDALKDKGMEHVNMGEHAESLASFEASLTCRPDPYVVQLAFMASCNSGNAAKAKEYYKKLAPAQQSRFKVMCIRNKVNLD